MKATTSVFLIGTLWVFMVPLEQVVPADKSVYPPRSYPACVRSLRGFWLERGLFLNITGHAQRLETLMQAKADDFFECVGISAVNCVETDQINGEGVTCDAELPLPPNSLDIVAKFDNGDPPGGIPLVTGCLDKEKKGGCAAFAVACLKAKGFYEGDNNGGLCCTGKDHPDNDPDSECSGGEDDG